jgi:capsular exopolysaccharide synthesis family protein
MSILRDALKRSKRESRMADQEQLMGPGLSANCSPATSPDAEVDGGLLAARAPSVGAGEGADGKDAGGTDGVALRSIDGLTGQPEPRRRSRPWLPWLRKSPPRNGHVPGPALVVDQESLARAGEQFQVLRARLEAFATEHDRRVILITSALQGEGKSFVALNLAATLARPASPVLLVDADLRTPSLHRCFNLPSLRGLLDYLQGDATFEKCLHETSFPGLRLVPAGGISCSAPESFAGPRMREFIHSAQGLQPPHYVLIDVPAALAAAETQILTRLVEATLVVVAANTTPRDAVLKTLDILRDAPTLGIVFNRFEPSYSASRRLKQSRLKFPLHQ